MPKIAERISKRLKSIIESFPPVGGGDPAGPEGPGGPASTPWKDPNDPNYDRQWAEDALFHTIGPLMDNPRWSPGDWGSKSEPVPGFNPGGPAPRWTPEEVVFAMAGDPALAFRPGGRDNPRAPQYGSQGGSPLWRLAQRVSRIYKRDTDPSFISDMYSNGFIPLMRMMQPGFDEGRSPFISYAMRNIQSAMEHGVGGTEQGIRATGGDSKSGVSGLESLLAAKTPEDARKIAAQIKGKYAGGKFHDKHADNPFGPFSHRVHQVANQYGDALESGNPELIDRVRGEITKLMDDIENEQSFIPGASTGMGQAISTPDRKTSIRVGSMDTSADEEKGPMAGNIPSYQEDEESTISQETVFHAIDIAMAHDLNKWLAKDPDLAAAATRFGWEQGEKIGKITANELRYLIRSLGPLGSSYPGKGKPRKNVSIPRDKPGWWAPLEDPEIEPIPGGSGLWKSGWTRNGYEEMGPTAIAVELTEEVAEFAKLGIPTARAAKTDGKTVISKVAVSNALQSALLKLKIIMFTQKDSMGLGESVKKELRAEGFPLMEDFDPVDRRIFFETVDWMIRKVTRKIVEDAPPGFSGTVEHMKGDGMGDDKAFSIAWSMYKKGAKPHKPTTKKGDKYVAPSERKKSEK